MNISWEKKNYVIGWLEVFVVNFIDWSFWLFNFIDWLMNLINLLIWIFMFCQMDWVYNLLNINGAVDFGSQWVWFYFTWIGSLVICEEPLTLSVGVLE